MHRGFATAAGDSNLTLVPVIQGYNANRKSEASPTRNRRLVEQMLRNRESPGFDQDLVYAMLVEEIVPATEVFLATGDLGAAMEVLGIVREPLVACPSRVQ